MGNQKIQCEEAFLPNAQSVPGSLIVLFILFLVLNGGTSTVMLLTCVVSCSGTARTYNSSIDSTCASDDGYDAREKLMKSKVAHALMMVCECSPSAVWCDVKYMHAPKVWTGTSV